MLRWTKIHRLLLSQFWTRHNDFNNCIGYFDITITFARGPLSTDGHSLLLSLLLSFCFIINSLLGESMKKFVSVPGVNQGKVSVSEHFLRNFSIWTFSSSGTVLRKFTIGFKIFFTLSYKSTVSILGVKSDPTCKINQCQHECQLCLSTT